MHKGAVILTKKADKRSYIRITEQDQSLTKYTIAT